MLTQHAWTKGGTGNEGSAHADNSRRYQNRQHAPPPYCHFPQSPHQVSKAGEEGKLDAKMATQRKTVAAA